jgi:hypothetical protein
MGVLTDFVVAERTEAHLVGQADVPSEAFRGIDAKGIDQVKMATLYAILTGTDYDPDFLAADDSFLYTGSEDGPWVQAIPDDMVRRLAELLPHQLSVIAEHWLASEEFDPRYSNWSPEAVTWFLGEIRDLSRVAISEKKTLFMWTCL